MIPRTPSRKLWICAVALVVGFASPLAAATKAPSRASARALPDTGLFAPVARQLRAREARLAQLPVTQSPERFRLLLSTGRATETVGPAPALTGQPALALAWARVLLARKDFAPLAALMEEIERSEATSGEDGERTRPATRELRYLWWFARDDGARIDSLSRDELAESDERNAVPDLLAAGRLAYDMLNEARADSCFARALALRPPSASPDSTGLGRLADERGLALVGLGLGRQKKREWDASLTRLREALETSASPEALVALSETLIRLGRTDEAIAAVEWAVRLDPYYDSAQYFLGNGYARRNYTQLALAYPRVFADAVGRRALAHADSLLGAGRREPARAAYARIVASHPGWADARVRLASLDFEDGRFAESRDGCFVALRACPEYGRAHALLAKALEAQRFTIDVHRAAYEARFAQAPTPEVPGIERLVLNWRSLSPRHQKRVALSVAPWRHFVPVLVAGGATFYIKPMYMLLSECPGQEPLRDQRIDYDSRLWDDVRGCGGYHTVTGIEDVERTIFDRYNTVLHELTHQVHGVLPADDGRAIQECYRRAKERDDVSHEGFLSRYAGGSVYEYFAEGANSLDTPMRDAYDPREIVRERLDQRDPDLRKLVTAFLARMDVSASYPVAYSAGGDDRVERGRVAEAIPLYRQALTQSPSDETALVSLANALVLGGRGAAAESVATRAVAAHPTSGRAQVQLAEAMLHAGRGLPAASASLAAARPSVRAEDRYVVDAELGALAWCAGDGAQATAAFDSVLAYQSDSPEGLRGRAAALALAERWDEAFKLYAQAVQVRTGDVGLRCDVARDLLRAGRADAARAHLDEARLLDEQNPTAEALRAWASLAAHRTEEARQHARQALAWGPWCDLARIVSGAIEAEAGHSAAARAAWQPVLERIAKHDPPEYVYRPKLAVWEETHRLPAVERALLTSFETNAR